MQKKKSNLKCKIEDFESVVSPTRGQLKSLLATVVSINWTESQPFDSHVMSLTIVRITNYRINFYR